MLCVLASRTNGGRGVNRRPAHAHPRAGQRVPLAQVGVTNHYRYTPRNLKLLRPQREENKFLQTTHLLHYDNRGMGTATRSPVPRSIRYRRAGTRTCLPTAPSGQPGLEWLKDYRIQTAALVEA